MPDADPIQRSGHVRRGFPAQGRGARRQPGDELYQHVARQVRSRVPPVKTPTLRLPVQPPPVRRAAPSGLRAGLIEEPDEVEPPEVSERAPPVDDRYAPQQRYVGQPVMSASRATRRSKSRKMCARAIVADATRACAQLRIAAMKIRLRPVCSLARRHEPPGGYPGSRREAPQTQQAVPALWAARPAISPVRSTPAAMKPTATLACPMVSALDRWVFEARAAGGA